MNTSLYNFITFGEVTPICCKFIMLSLFLHLPPFTFAMADDRIAEMIAQSKAALVATLAEALQGMRAHLVHSTTCGMRRCIYCRRATSAIVLRESERQN